MRGNRTIPRALFQSALFICAWLLLATARADSFPQVAQVRWALDGDSLLLADNRQVRLLGINTPEFGKDGKPDQPFARAARDRASALTRGQRVRLVQDEERKDRHGRMLAYAELLDGRDVQQILLEEGLAWYVAVPPNTARLERYRAAEAQARNNRRGFWGTNAYEPIVATRLSPKQTGFQRIGGTITNVRIFNDGVEATLTPTVRIVIAASVMAELHQEPQRLRGKRILARGWVTEYKGRLRLRLKHPAMLEELS